MRDRSAQRTNRRVRSSVQAAAMIVVATLTALAISSHAAITPFSTPTPASGQQSTTTAEPIENPTITLWGGAQEVAGSMGILAYRDARWMIDCGMYYPSGDGSPRQRQRRADQSNAQIEVDPSTIDAVFLTHAHLDHIGRIPLLVSRGYRGPIFVTTATGTLAAPMLDSQIRLDRITIRDWVYSGRTRGGPDTRPIAAHWRARCEWRQQIAERNERTFKGSLQDMRDFVRGWDRETPLRVNPCRTCSGIELESVLRLFVPIEFGEVQQLAHGVEVTPQSAGHIPGASSFIFTMFEGAEQRAARRSSDPPIRPRAQRRNDQREPIWRVVFSGDLGNAMSPIVPLPEPSPPAAAVIVETTYGDNTRASDHEEERRHFREQVANVIDRDGIVLIPAFALDRTQKIMYEMTLAKREGLLARNVPILCPSPSATNFNELYRRSQRNRWFPPEVARDRQAFSPPGLIEGSRAADMVNDEQLPRPCVIITTSGMLTDAFGRMLLPILGPDERNAIFLVGYQAPATPGGQLRAGERQLEINEEDDQYGPAPDLLQVKAEVQSFGVFSGHGDARELSEWMDALRRDGLVLLNHGEKSALELRAEQLRREGFTNVHTPGPGESFEVPVKTRAPQSER